MTATQVYLKSLTADLNQFNISELYFLKDMVWKEIFKQEKELKQLLSA